MLKKSLSILLLTSLVLLTRQASASYGKTTLDESNEHQKEVFSATSTISGQRESSRQHVKQITEQPYNNDFEAVLADLTKPDAGKHGYVANSNVGLAGYEPVGPQAGYAPTLREELPNSHPVGGSELRDLKSGYGGSSSGSSSGYGSVSTGYGQTSSLNYDYGSVGPQAGYAPTVRTNDSNGRQTGYGNSGSVGYGSSATASSSSSSTSGYGKTATNTGYGTNVGLRNSIGANENNNKNGIAYDSQTDLQEILPNVGASIGGGHSFGHSGDNGSGSGSSGGYINRNSNGVSTGYSSHSESSSGYPYAGQSPPPYPYAQPAQYDPAYYPAQLPRAYAPRPQQPYLFPPNHPHYQQPQHDPLYHQQPFQHDPLFHQQHDPLYHQQNQIQHYPAPYPHLPERGYALLDHRLKTNTEYKEEGHHTGSLNALNGAAGGNNGCGYGSGFCGGYNGAFNRPGI